MAWMMKTVMVCVCIHGHSFIQRDDFFQIFVEMSDLVPATTFSPRFEEKSFSLLQCVDVCIRIPNCASVFVNRTLSTCRGFGNPFLYRGLMHSSQGMWYIGSVSDLCSPGGYVWDSDHRICYKYHSTRVSIPNAVSTCNSELARLLLVTSDNVHTFAVDFMQTHSTGSLYIQGSRDSVFSSQYVDDHGRMMTNVKWGAGEPSLDGVYVRLNTEAYRLEATPGGTHRRFICQRGQF